jgi:hypothetical protein
LLGARSDPYPNQVGDDTSRGLESAPDERPLGERAEEIRGAGKSYPATGYATGYGYRPGFSLHEEVDAARAYGCLLEFKDGGHYGSHTFVSATRSSSPTAAWPSSSGWRRPRASAAKGRPKRRDEALAAAGVDPESEEADETAQQELRRQERARAGEQIAARGANLDLGVKLAERFHKPMLTKEIGPPAGAARVRPRRGRLRGARLALRRAEATGRRAKTSLAGPTASPSLLANPSPS